MSTCRRPLIAAVVLAFSAVGSAGAHHSGAMFDRDKKTPIEGVVKELQWTNPHVWIQVNIPDAKGATTEWGVECTSVNFMTRRGWRRDSLKPGDRIALVIAPLRDGSPGGSLLSVTSVNGKPLVLVPEE